MPRDRAGPARSRRARSRSGSTASASSPCCSSSRCSCRAGASLRPRGHGGGGAAHAPVPRADTPSVAATGTDDGPAQPPARRTAGHSSSLTSRSRCSRHRSTVPAGSCRGPRRPALQSCALPVSPSRHRLPSEGARAGLARLGARAGSTCDWPPSSAAGLTADCPPDWPSATPRAELALVPALVVGPALPLRERVVTAVPRVRLPCAGAGRSDGGRSFHGGGGRCCSVDTAAEAGPAPSDPRTPPADRAPAEPAEPLPAPVPLRRRIRFDHGTKVTSRRGDRCPALPDPHHH